MSERYGEHSVMVTSRHTLAAMPRATVAVATLVAVLAVAGCGSGATTTVSVPSHTAQPSVRTANGASRAATGTASSDGSASSTKARGGNTSSEGATRTPERTAAGPAFAQQEASDQELSAALDVLRQHGFAANGQAAYHPDQTLRVLIGTRTGSGGGYDQQAFFFEDGRYLGTDTSQPSASVEVVSQSDTEVRLAYSLYWPHDSLCCPTGGRANVRFQLNNGELQALDSIPPVSSSNAPGRR